jgi:glycosyltransferase involved in cell wall biosynthesis
MHSRALPSGIGQHVTGMVDAFVEAGQEVEVALGGELLAAGGREAASGGPTSVVRSRLRRLVPTLAWETARDARLLLLHGRVLALTEAVARAFAPQLVYERVSWLQDVGRRVARRHGVPRVVELNAPLESERVHFDGRSLLAPLARRRLRRTLESATLVVTVSTALLEHVAGTGVPRRKLLALPNAVRPVPLPPRPPREGLTIGLPASFLPWHGLELLVEAFARARAARPDLRLLWVGSGPAVEDGLRRARDLGVAAAVEVVPRVPPDRIHEQLARMDIGVMPSSNWYGSPMKIFEYGLHGLPVVSVAAPPVAEVMQHGVHGLLFAEGDLDAFAAHLVSLCGDAALRRRLGETWRAKVLAEHTWARNVERLMRRLSELGVAAP